MYIETKMQRRWFLQTMFHDHALIEVPVGGAHGTHSGHLHGCRYIYTIHGSYGSWCCFLHFPVKDDEWVTLSQRKMGEKHHRTTCCCCCCCCCCPSDFYVLLLKQEQTNKTNRWWWYAFLQNFFVRVDASTLMSFFWPTEHAEKNRSNGCERSFCGPPRCHLKSGWESHVEMVQEDAETHPTSLWIRK